MSCQIAILDDSESLPISYRCFQIYKLVHFYYQKEFLYLIVLH